MKIEISNSDVQFDSISIGNAFIWEQKLYIRLPLTKISTGSTNAYQIGYLNGYHTFNPTDKIISVSKLMASS